MSARTWILSPVILQFSIKENCVGTRTKDSLNQPIRRRLVRSFGDLLRSSAAMMMAIEPENRYSGNQKLNGASLGSGRLDRRSKSKPTNWCASRLVDRLREAKTMPSIGCSFQGSTKVEADMADDTVVYTIGQGSRLVSELVTELTSRHIRYLCDARSVPISNYAPAFCRDELRATLGAYGIVYVSVGDSLGGRPRDRSVYSANGRVDYDLMIASAQFVSGLDRVMRGARDGHRIAIFCSEGRPEQCHRSKAIGRALTAQGIDVRHIDADGSEVGQGSVLGRLAPPPTLINLDTVDERRMSRRAYR